VWGDGLSGSLGIGKRIECALEPVLVPLFQELGLAVRAASCTRGQLNPQRLGPPVVPGQEGPRIHAVTSDGGLWIAGATHKVITRSHPLDYRGARPNCVRMSAQEAEGGGGSTAIRTLDVAHSYLRTSLLVVVKLQ
jgi:hypothetical protein